MFKMIFLMSGKEEISQQVSQFAAIVTLLGSSFKLPNEFCTDRIWQSQRWWWHESPWGWLSRDLPTEKRGRLSSFSITFFLVSLCLLPPPSPVKPITCLMQMSFSFSNLIFREKVCLIKVSREIEMFGKNSFADSPFGVSLICYTLSMHTAGSTPASQLPGLLFSLTLLSLFFMSLLKTLSD